KKIYFCPHTPEHLCDCRKPHLKFMQESIDEFNIDASNSWVIGDHPHDAEMGIKAGAKGIYLLSGHGEKHKDDLKKKNIVPTYIAKDFLDATNFILENSNPGISKKETNKKRDIRKIKTIEELEKLSKDLKKNGERIVTTNGVFDILHIGHIRYLQQAKKLGDVLIVAVNSDASVKENKGPKRPLNNEHDRMEALAALECVDYVMVFSEKTPVSLLEKLKPDVHVKGGDYTMDKIIEKDAVEKNNGKIVLIPEVKGYATTKLIDKILQAYGE
ncbi:MAG: D-glycero-beta-D-manno-heptose 1-phosphate adenylyltransferase, partial [Planctomycetota bacterium]